MSARIIVTLILEYGGNDSAEYDAAMEAARLNVTLAGEDVAFEHDPVRMVEVQVSG